MKTYCLFCKTGSEKIVEQQVNKVDRGVIAIAPIKILQEKRQGKWDDREQPLLPSYVFLYSEAEIQINICKQIPNLYRLLEYGVGQRELYGMDYEYSMWVYRHKGIISPSKVMKEGKTVKVIEGPLLDGIGKIIKLDRHKRKVWIEYEFDGMKRVVSLSAECLIIED